MTPLIAGNWKMNTTRASAKELAQAIVRGLPPTLDGVDVALYPPYPCIASVAEAVAGSDIRIGAQNFYPESGGAYTGEISPAMLLDLGATEVLIGHSERRHVLHESDEFIAQKLRFALAEDFLATLCVGETLEERDASQTEHVIARQLRSALADIEAKCAADITVAYEPVWAIGTGLTATAEQAGAAHEFIRSLLVELWGENGRSIRILYGGSVKPNNAAELMAVPEIGGVLVGGASLDSASFCAIVSAAR